MTIYLRSGRNLFFLASRDVPSDTPVSSAPPVAIFLWTMVVGPKEYFVIESALLKSSVKIHAIQRMSALTTSVLGPCYRLQEAKTPSLVEKWWSFTPCLLYVPNSWMQLQAAIFLEMYPHLSTARDISRKAHAKMSCPSWCNSFHSCPKIELGVTYIKLSTGIG